MAYNLDVCAAKYAQVAQAMGAATPGASIEDQAQAAIDAVVALREDIGITRSICDLGGTDELLPLLVGDALADGVNLSNARPVDAQAIEALYRAAW